MAENYEKKLPNAETYDVSKRANEIQDALPEFAKDKVTTAVGLTDNDIALVATSAGRLRPAQRNLLTEGEYEITGTPGNHA